MGGKAERDPTDFLFAPLSPSTPKSKYLWIDKTPLVDLAAMSL